MQPAGPTIPADPGPPVRRRTRGPIIISAIAAVAVLAVAGGALAFYLAAPSDPGIEVCHRVDRLGQDLADGGRPVLTPDELDEMADGLQKSENEVLSHFGREYLRWALAGEHGRFKGAQGTLHLHSQVLPACVVAGVEMKTAI